MRGYVAGDVRAPCVGLHGGQGRLAMTMGGKNRPVITLDGG